MNEEEQTKEEMIKQSVLITARKVIRIADLRDKDFITRVDFYKDCVEVHIRVTNDEITLLMDYEDWGYFYASLKKASQGYAQTMSRKSKKRKR